MKRNRYGEHPISKVTPLHRTKQELMDKRRESNRMKIEMITKNIDKQNKLHQSLEKPFVRNELAKSTTNPRFTSIK